MKYYSRHHPLKSFFTHCHISLFFLMLTGSLALSAPSQDLFISAQNAPFPNSAVKSPYSTLTIPTKMQPLMQPLSNLLAEGYQIKTATPYPFGVLFTLQRRKAGINPQTALCLFNPPLIGSNRPKGSDANVPTSECWLLN